MRAGDAKKLSFPVVITSFEICMIDRPHLEHYEWQYLILVIYSTLPLFSLLSF